MMIVIIIVVTIKMQQLFVSVSTIRSQAIIMLLFTSLDTNYTVDTSCNNGDVRLVGGISELQGQVEICYNKIWGSVCHNSWSRFDANVVCKHLGYQPKGKYFNLTIAT